MTTQSQQLLFSNTFHSELKYHFQFCQLIVIGVNSLVPIQHQPESDEEGNFISSVKQHNCDAAQL